MSNRAFHRPVVGAALILLSTCLAPSGYSSAPKETPPPAPAPTPAAEVVYRTFNYPQRWNTTGALFFDSREAVKACFDRVYSGRSQGFRPCEPKALAVVPPGLALKLLEKWDAEAITRVELLEGERKGLVGFVHELWITPSPFEARPASSPSASTGRTPPASPTPLP